LIELIGMFTYLQSIEYLSNAIDFKRQSEASGS